MNAAPESKPPAIGTACDSHADPGQRGTSGVAAASVLLLLLRYDARLVPAFAATVVLMTGAVQAAQAGAWLPFAADAAATVAVAAWLTRYLRRDVSTP